MFICLSLTSQTVFGSLSGKRVFDTIKTVNSYLFSNKLSLSFCFFVVIIQHFSKLKLFILETVNSKQIKLSSNVRECGTFNYFKKKVIQQEWQKSFLIIFMLNAFVFLNLKFGCWNLRKKAVTFKQHPEIVFINKDFFYSYILFIVWFWVYKYMYSHRSLEPLHNCKGNVLTGQFLHKILLANNGVNCIGICAMRHVD